MPSFDTTKASFNEDTDFVLGGDNATGEFVNFTRSAMVTGLSSALQPISAKGQANGYAELDADGKVPVAQLPDTTLTVKVTAADQAERLALTAADVQPGDYVEQTDNSTTYLLTGADPSVAGNWTAVAPEDWASITNKPDFDALYQERDEQSVANGYPSLDANAKVPTDELPDHLITAPETQALTGDLAITDASAALQHLDPNGADRNVDIDISTTGRGVVIVHDGSAHELIIRNGSDVEQARLRVGERAAIIKLSTSLDIVRTAPSTGPRLLGKLLSADMNATTDQAIAVDSSSYHIRRIMVCGASISLDTAAGGVYSAASKAGTAIVAAAQVYSALTTAAKVLDLTLANDDLRTEGTLYLSLTTAQGAVATADVYIFGEDLQ